MTSNVIAQLVDSIAQLAEVNRLTGLWDHARNSEAAKPIELVRVEFIVKAEKQSRFNVEQRAFFRRRIDALLSDLIESNSHQTRS